MNKVNVFFFATLRDYVGAKSLQLEVPLDTTVGELKDLLIESHPRLSLARDTLMAAINREYAGDDQQIPLHAEVAFFPPVSGG